MKLLILKADDSNDMDNISSELSEKKFKTIESENHFILMKKRRVGNILIHIFFILLFLKVSSLFLMVNVVYFAYSYLYASPHVLITTEKVDIDGNPLEFNSMDEVLSKANAIL